MTFRSVIEVYAKYCKIVLSRFFNQNICHDPKYDLDVT